MTTKCWKHGLVSGIITGLANSFLAAVGTTTASTIGVDIQQLNFRQLVVITIMGGIVGAAAYLKQSPLPDDETNTCNLDSH